MVSIILPQNFHDENPGRGPWHEIKDPPKLFVYVQAVFPDGTTDRVVWTGNIWWNKRMVSPVAWRPLPEERET